MSVTYKGWDLGDPHFQTWRGWISPQQGLGQVTLGGKDLLVSQ